jgi:hypothetical protein
MIMDCGYQIKSKAKTFSSIKIFIKEDFKAFKHGDNIFIKHPLTS